MNRHDWTGVLVAVVLLSGCADAPVNESARLEHQDSPQAVRIKALLLEEPGLAGAAIDVDIRNGRIVLEGFVETGDGRERAEAIAREHSPGSEVENRIIVK
ncbi:BON domain-containing protein [Marinobacter orientalis]|uniref:BON domain-containing protein n=1 Tax=Marinobacter orientalis TaxID=1928859 RepID=A0A7Y0WTG4_9GAMM|nr:BON domain-containing protein [Marinobacter orientalis]NMT64811.1 BON domain-containing protein [Marinobacter orientalis]TGX48802.1 BON domain-containing protein [Marinobacter orientalis]